MKKLFSNVLFYGTIALVIIVPLTVFFHSTAGLIQALGNGSFVLGLIVLPFVIIGGINVFRGFCAVLDKDDKKYNFKKNWQVSIYFLFHIGSYLALFYALIKCF